jgi:hypothetical protein
MNGRKVDLRSAEPKVNDNKPNLINKAMPSNNNQSYGQLRGRDDDRRAYRDGESKGTRNGGYHRDGHRVDRDDRGS